MKYSRRAPRLAFAGVKPKLEPGRLYMTLRAGDKWVGNKVDGKDRVVLLDPAGKPFANATLEDVYYMPLGVVPTPYLLYNYDPAYHTHGGALAGLRQTYSECEREDRRQDVHPDSLVSVVFFVLDEPEDDA